MRFFKCPDCKNFRECEDTIIAIRCACGAGMEEVDSNHNPLTEAMKICDKNECKTCPIRNIKCFGGTL